MHLDDRPNPEALLKQIHDDATKTTKGQLKIFLGAAAGVGKTYSMLKAASQLLAEGEDVVVGCIETHGRSETECLLPVGIEYIPLKLVEYKGSILKEFDIDKALLRKPQVIIVDELAHTNAANSRNSKRYQDIVELLNAGISVYTALNVQHIESLNNIVEQITEIKITETVPDQIIETADEVVLIDLPPEELIERLTEGKIYPKERIESALKNFFRKGNLTALRELSLRKTAQKVDSQVLQYRNKNAIENVWASTDKLLLVLERGYESEKIIRHAKNSFDKGYSQWFVAYVESSTFELRSPKEKQRLVDLLDLAKQLGAITLNLVGSDPAVAIADCVMENNINTIMLAQYKLNLYYKLFGKSLADKLSEIIPGINLNLVTDEIKLEKQYVNQHKKKTNYPKIWSKTVYFLIIFTLLGLVLHPLYRWVSNENILMIYLLVIILVNKGRGKISALTVALIGTVSYDFFIVPPYYSFVLANSQYVITFIAMVIIGITFNIINGNLRFQVSKLGKLQQQSESFNELNKDLAGAMIENQVIETVSRFFRRMFNSNFMLLLPTLEEELLFKGGVKLSRYDPSIASWVFSNNQIAGLNTDTFAGNSLFYAPILSKVRSRGVLVIEPQDEVKFFLPDVQHLLDNLLEQLAITLERIHFTQIAIQTEIELSKQALNKSKLSV